MVYKLGNLGDLGKIPSVEDEALYDSLYEFLCVLSNEYGSDRDVDNDDGGYVLYVTEGTPMEEVTALFNYEQAFPEWVNTIKSQPPFCAALYLTNNEFSVVVIMAIADAPDEITREFEEGF